ncbi:uncharacterized protein TRIVIDRAFT_92415 [Trichoderma virens Gv29-8]|uniref:Uncharacterized protein n=1 Tax=Hypocrea virens (strain Gv29-8 / FGSC 10586) TaxID=413071 RepID=G9N9U4_HYPVG|nr:uncharacterized protein TRIVIDRAFT_92415 [Trichoderma virens Gv29-8]EHK16712.1 hypothetical protein TRIVIDRAFT_92415 [Trichoderma virens Gv29-8]
MPWEIDRTKPKDTNHLLPQRSVSAIHVKMGELRKKVRKETSDPLKAYQNSPSEIDC